VSFNGSGGTAHWRPSDDLQESTDSTLVVAVALASGGGPSLFASDDSLLLDWPGDPSSRASYSCPSPGQVTTLGPILHSGLGHLHFASEHTSYAFAGYMEGALRSGVEVARRLAVRDGVRG
jgi:monoamine oxidase